MSIFNTIFYLICAILLLQMFDTMITEASFSVFLPPGQSPPSTPPAAAPPAATPVTVLVANPAAPTL